MAARNYVCFLCQQVFTFHLDIQLVRLENFMNFGATGYIFPEFGSFDWNNELLKKGLLLP
jgi:hypothetical protein